MKILVVTTKCPWPLNEGRALRTYNLIRQAARYHEITLCTFVQSRSEVDGLENMREFCSEVHAIPLYMSWPRLALMFDVIRELFGPVPLHAKKYARMSMRKLIARLLAKTQFDVLHLDMLQLAELADLGESMGVVLVEHNVESQILERRFKNEKNFLRRIYLKYQANKLRRYENQKCGEVDQVVTVSDGDKEILQGMGVTTPITVVPNAVDVEFFQPAPEKPAADRLVYVGSLAWFPNEDAIRFFMDEIMPKISASRPALRLDVIGQVPNEAMISQWKSNDRVRFLGFVDDIRPHVLSASVYIVPLRIGGGTRLKILDAMAMGKALVTTSIGCEGLGLEQGRQALIADTPDEFAKAVIGLLEHSSKIKELGENSRAYVCENFRWEQIAAVMEDVYSSAGAVRAAARDS